MQGKFKDLLTAANFAAIIIYIDEQGELALETNVDIDLVKDMTEHVAKFIDVAEPVDITDTDSTFVSRTNLH